MAVEAKAFHCGRFFQEKETKKEKKGEKIDRKDRMKPGQIYQIRGTSAANTVLFLPQRFNGKAVVIRETPLCPAVGAGVVGEPSLGPLVLPRGRVVTGARRRSDHEILEE